MSKIFLIPPDVLQNSSDPPPQKSNHPIIKVAKLVNFLFETEIDHPLGLLKVKAGEFKRNFNSCSSKTRKFASYQYPLHD